MFTRHKPADDWQAVMELRSRQEIIHRWLANPLLPENLQQNLVAMLEEVEAELYGFTPQRGRSSVA